MAFFEKWSISINKIVRNFLLHLVFWYGSFLFFAFLTGEEQIFKVYLNFLSIDDLYFVILVLSVCISLLFTLVDGLFSYRVLRFFPRRLMIFLKSLLYLASAFILILLAAGMPMTVFTNKNYTEILRMLPEMDIHFYRFLVYFYLSGFLINFLKAVIRKVGPGNFQHWLLGMLNKPLEQERIFMFIDMKDSTSYAEKLGHKKFSHLVQDVFNDLAVVDNYQAEIYQYLGDGAIISWRLKDGLRHNNCLKAYFAFAGVIKRRRRYYKRRYKLEPQFKAGAHAGKVMVLQVGQIRREISYNGDTINTAARIESICNELKSSFLISGDLQQQLKDPKEFFLSKKKEVDLKGKRQKVDVFAVREKQKTRKKAKKRKKK